MELEALENVVDALRALGATLVAISPQQKQYSKQVVRKCHLSFQLLSDTGNKVASQFGIVFGLPKDLIELYTKFGAVLPRFNAEGSWRLPMPGRFIIDRQGIIQHREINPDYTKRPDPETLIELVSTCT